MEQSSCRIQHTDQPEVPAIVTIVNSSRVVADIKRDLSRVTGQTLQFPVRNDSNAGSSCVRILRFLYLNGVGGW